MLTSDSISQLSIPPHTGYDYFKCDPFPVSQLLSLFIANVLPPCFT